jgi:glycosyltransferase involved in cell wall biosynthesis
VKVVHVHRMRGIGGSERHLLTLLPALAERGLDVAFVGLDDPEWDAEPFYERLSVETLRLPCPRDLDPRLARRLRRALHSVGAEVAHSHLVHADVYSALASLRAPWALVSTKHNDDPFRTGSFRFAERTLTRRVDAVIAITDALARFTVERVGLPAEKVSVVHYGLDELPGAWGPDAGPAADGPLLLAIARLTAQKGIDVAVRALAELPSGVRLAVLGEGPERGALETLARSLGVDERLLLPGRVGDVAAWLRAAEVVVHPARWEGFGLALLEAMLAAKPVVASRVSSVPEIVADGETGLLVAPDDHRALATAVGSLLQDPERARRLGAAGLERARREFSVERMTSRTIDVYERALAARRAGKSAR